MPENFIELPERIIIGGSPGSGKTYAHLTIARALPERKFYIIDPDDGVRRVWYKEFPEVTNIEYYFTPSWFTTDFATFDSKGAEIKKLIDGSNRKTIFRSGVADAWKTIKPKLKQGDWITLEHLHLLWDGAQDTFSDEVFDKNIGMYFLEKRKAMKAGAKRLEAFEGWQDWPVIKKMHNDDFINKVCYETQAHVFMTTALSITQPNAREDPQIKAFYGDSSIRFEGEKHNVFRAQTKLIFKQAGKGEDRSYIMNTFQKDRGREHLVECEWSDFFYDYLCLVAGWS